MDIFSTNVLAKVVERLHTPSSFLLDTFFPNVQTSDKEEIFFDVTDSKPRISPFVSPLLPGKVVDSGGYQTKSFKPAYVKDKRPLDANPLLTVDMLWDFFYEKGRASLSTDIRTILDCYARTETKQLSSDEKRVLKAVLLLQAISQKVGGSVEFFVPNDKNINNAFEGTDIEREAARIAAKLERDKIIYKKSLGGGEFQYSALTGGVDTGKIEEIKEQLKDRPTATLIQEGSLSSTLNLPKSLALRYFISYASLSDFDTVIKRLRAEEDKYLNKLCAVVTLAKDDNEAATLNKKIKDAVSNGSYK